MTAKYMHKNSKIQLLRATRKKLDGPPIILWPSSEPCVRSHGSLMKSGLFPTAEQVEKRYKKMKASKVAVADFLRAMKSTLKRIWILDKHLNLEELRPLEEGFRMTPATDVRILTKSDPKKMKNLLNKLRNGSEQEYCDKYPAIIRVVQLDRFSSRVHDRFAILDGELWHFGSNVGGAHYSLSAFSRGWDADDTRAVSSFDTIWDWASGKTRGR